MTTAWIEHRGVSLHYAITGQGAQSLVLFHGLTGTLEIWDRVAARLAGRCRILRADQRGAGLSEKVRAPYSIDDLVEDASGVLTASGLPPPYIVTGHAAGAAIAVAVADRLAGSVCGLVLCAPALGADAERAKLLVQRSEIAVREGIRAIVDDTLARSYPANVISDRAVYENYRSRLLAIDPVCYAAANRVLATVNLDAALARTTAPCLLIAGKHDLLRPPELVAGFAKQIQHAEVAVIDSGHIMPLQAPNLLASTIEAFVARLRRRTP
jgi:3-oxoadipate enol-lactonase